MNLRRRSLLTGAAGLAIPTVANALLSPAILGPCITPGTGPGPPASSGFITADFTSPQAYNSPGVGQQVISQRMWGTATGGAGNSLGTPYPAGDFSIFAYPTWQSLISIANPALYYFVSGLAQGNTQPWWNVDSTVNTAAFTNLVNNFYLADPLGVSGCMFGISFPGDGTQGITDTASMATAAGNLATYLNGVTMPNGKKFPVVGFLGRDEPDGTFSESLVVTYYNAIISAVKAVNSNFIVSGPQCSYAGSGGMYPAMPNATNVDVVSWDTYIDPSTALTTTRGQDDLSIILCGNYYGLCSGSGSFPDYLPKALLIGGYNIDSNCTDAQQHTYVGAIYMARMLMQSINLSPVPMWANVWDAFGDGTCGLVQDPNQGFTPMLLTPEGYFNGQGVRHVYGPRWQTPTNSAGVYVCAVNPTASNCSIMIINSGQGAQSGQTVALSHWPVNSTGNGTANVWQMTSSVTAPGQDGTHSTTPVTAGVTGALNFPDPSITIISI